MSLITIRTRVLIFLLLLVSLLPQAAAGAQSTAPILSHARTTAPVSTLLLIEGHGFTPGGLVYLAVYDRWGVENHAHVWTVASPAVFGPNGSADPALGYVPAGTIQETIDLFAATVYGPNGSQDPALGYTPGFDAVQASAAVYGPNGSADPALGYVPAASQLSGGTVCARSLMVRAYDAEASTWSDTIDATSGC
jgi:hypothetical protein